MKLTGTKLKQLILEVLEEAALQPSELPEDVYVMVEMMSEDEISIDYVDETGKQLKFNKEGEPYGTLIVDTTVQMADDLPCLDAMMIAFSDASHGWGPMIYDVAMEVATIMKGGLVSDRTILSPDGYGIWDFYDNKRSDVEKIQLDNEVGELTPDNEQDDCLQSTSYDYAKKNNVDWPKTATSKIYRKQPTTLRALRDSGKLILKDINLSF